MWNERFIRWELLIFVLLCRPLFFSPVVIVQQNLDFGQQGVWVSLLQWVAICRRIVKMCLGFFCAICTTVPVNSFEPFFFFSTSRKNEYYKISFYWENWSFVGKWMTAVVVNYLCTMDDTASLRKNDITKKCFFL